MPSLEYRTTSGVGSVPAFDAAPSLEIVAHLHPVGLRCVILGASPESLARAELLAFAGARVDLIDPVRTDDVEAMLARTATATGSVRFVPRRWLPGDCVAASVVVSALNDIRMNAKVAEDARRSGSLLEIIGEPNHSTIRIA